MDDLSLSAPPTTSAAPSGAAGGDLGGTYPNPTVSNLHLTGDTAVNNKLTNITDPTSAQDAATKSYVDAIAASLAPKDSVRAGTTTNGTLASAYENGDTIDGVVLATGDRIAIMNQSTASENGIYTVNASGAPTRSTDANTGAAIRGAFFFVEEGTANADKMFFCTTNAPITINVTNLTFSQFAATQTTFAIPNSNTFFANDITKTTTAEQDVTGDITVAAATGDVLEVMYQLQLVSNGLANGCNFHYLINGALNNIGKTSTIASQALTSQGIGYYTVQAGDISGGLVTLRLRTSFDSTNSTTLKGGNNVYNVFSVKNLRH